MAFCLTTYSLYLCQNVAPDLRCHMSPGHYVLKSIFEGLLLNFPDAYIFEVLWWSKASYLLYTLIAVACMSWGCYGHETGVSDTDLIYGSLCGLIHPHFLPPWWTASQSQPAGCSTGSRVWPIVWLGSLDIDWEMPTGPVHSWWAAVHCGVMWLVGIPTVFQTPLTIPSDCPNGR